MKRRHKIAIGLTAAAVFLLAAFPPTVDTRTFYQTWHLVPGIEYSYGDHYIGDAYVLHEGKFYTLTMSWLKWDASLNWDGPRHERHEPMSSYARRALQGVHDSTERITVASFDLDHAPIGPRLREELMPRYMTEKPGGKLALTTAGENALK